MRAIPKMTATEIEGFADVADEWYAAAKEKWQVFYPFVAGRVKSHLLILPAGTVPISTDELVEAITPSWPFRARAYKALNALADHELKDWWQPGVPKSILGGSKQIIPKRWRAPPTTQAAVDRTLSRISGRDRVIEECAKIADEHAEAWGAQMGSPARVIAAAIRALLAPEDATATPVQPALSWKLIREGGRDVEATTEFGDYVLSFDAPQFGTVNLWMAGAGVDDHTVFNRAKDAYEAAEADYAVRQPQPAPEDATATPVQP